MTARRFDPRVDLFYDGAWNDITDYVRVSEGVVISRGRPDEAGEVDPGSCKLTLENKDGRFSPRNPTSPLYGKIGRNTPLRVREASLTASPEMVVSDTFTRTLTGTWGATDTGHVWQPWLQGAPSTFALSTNGTTGKGTLNEVGILKLQICEVTLADCEVQIAITVDQLATGAAYTENIILRRVEVSEDYLFYRLRAEMATTGAITLSVCRGPTILSSAASAATYGANIKMWLKCRIEGYRVRGKIWRDGSSEPAAWEIDYTIPESSGTLSPAGAVGVGVSASTGNTNVAPVFTFDSFTATDLMLDDARFVGEVSTWPVAWDPSGTDVSASIEANGVLRRLGKAYAPLHSSIRRDLTLKWRGTPAAYWPLEDGSFADTVASAVGGPPALISGSPDLASYAAFDCSGPVATLKTGSLIQGVVEPYVATGFIGARQLCYIPASGIAADTSLMRLECSGTAARWDVQYDAAGNLRVQVKDSDGTTLLTSGYVGFSAADSQAFLGVSLTQNGADIDWLLVFVRITRGEAFGTFGTGTLAGQTIGRATRLTAAPNKDVTGMAVGHMVVMSDALQLSGEDEFLHGWLGETAVARMRRLCAEEGVTFICHGDAATSPQMGVQGRKAFVDLLEDCALADDGILTELRSAVGLKAVARRSLYNQTPKISVSYSGGQVAPPFQPKEDDAHIRNAIEATREGGSSWSVEQTTGPLAVSAVGRYDESSTVNVAYDDQLPDIAGWRLHMGTSEELRFPSVTVDLNAAPELKAQVTALDSGDLMEVTGPPEWLPRDDLSLMVQGYTEMVSPWEWVITANTTPGGPWNVFEVGDSVYGRLDTSGSYLVLDVDPYVTSLVVATEGLFVPWINSADRPGDFPFKIRVGGEVMTVSAIAGAVSPQTFTVVRSVNGVLKAQTAGTRVQIWRQP